eukprot:CAMPEP_0168503998 /NCGR_PEP_ID=MMETSP0228-20121227/76144_1 /TAXON_ID=133427 /ORGANISM="Protoceratium reticulatum, Strain CCCM 535 (=CCMP 1889)" /LENGTH=108 /DNA_ID=CAMNT_0008521071 /DNA_START=224 /DNA_END=547 /DNA_ORIENTATION=+
MTMIMAMAMTTASATPFPPPSPCWHPVGANMLLRGIAGCGRARASLPSVQFIKRAVDKRRLSPGWPSVQWPGCLATRRPSGGSALFSQMVQSPSIGCNSALSPARHSL